MKKRLLTSLAIIFVLAIAFILKVYVSDYFFDVLILAVGCFTAYETSKLLTKMGKYNNNIMATIFPCFVMLVFLLGAGYDKDLGIAYTIAIATALIVLFFALSFVIPLIFNKQTKVEMKTRKMDKQSVLKYSLTKALNTTVAFVYPAYLILFLTLINHFEDFSNTLSSLKGFDGWVSFYVLIFALLIPIFTDTFAYLSGGIFGGKKLAPKISPNKTISGAIGGLLWCVLLSVVVFFIFDAIPSMSSVLANAGINIWKVVVISFIGSILSQFGDLFESWLKRNAGVKDSGKFLPGHGGFLDRFDSYIFVAPYVFIAFSILFAVI